MREGDPLFEIDRRTVPGRLRPGGGQPGAGPRPLAHMEANYKRAKNLIGTRAISQADFDQAVSDRDEGEAAVKVAEAALHTAELNLNWTRVTAPISGRISRQMIDPGNLVKADDTALTTIVALDPMYAFFDIDERVMQRAGAGRKVEVGPGRENQGLVGPGRREGLPARGNDQLHRQPGGRADRHAPAPRAVSQSRPHPLARHVRADPGAGQRPASVAAGGGAGLGLRPRDRSSCTSLNDKDEVVRRDVEVGSLNDGLRVVQSGLKQGERVVLSGLQRVRPGKKVNAKIVAMAAKDLARRRGGRGVRRAPHGDSPGGQRRASRKPCPTANPKPARNRGRAASRRQPRNRGSELEGEVGGPSSNKCERGDLPSMFSRFFIDRPIFATVLSIVITLAGGLAMRESALGPVSAGHAADGASQLHVSRRQRRGGGRDRGRAHRAAGQRRGADAVHGVVVGQRRLLQSLGDLRAGDGPEPGPGVGAEPGESGLADAAGRIKQTGVTTRKRVPDILMCVNIISPHGRYDQLYLSNYALMYIRDELLRLPGISDIFIAGQRDYSMRIWVDPDKLAARDLTAGDVVAALREQNAEVACGQIGGPPVPRGAGDADHA